jgi:poly(3-hydroxybutyrate) depolymerase
VLAFIVSLATASFYKPLPQGQVIGQTTNVTITSSGIERSYLISIPPKYDCKATTPVIFSFHGANRNASQQQQLSQFSNPEFNDFAITVYPMGINVILSSF